MELSFSSGKRRIIRECDFGNVEYVKEATDIFEDIFPTCKLNVITEY